MERNTEQSTTSSPQLQVVLGAQHTAFGVIFKMFEDLTNSNKELEDRINTMGHERARDALKIAELTEELKVRRS